VASVVEAATAIGGQLVSVQAAKQSLEDLFASSTAGHASNDQMPVSNTEAK
jgi:hypothetical protein